MFATQILDDFQTKINSLDDKIDTLEKQLEDLRETKKNVLAEQQKNKTLIAAGQSALEQVQKFITLANSSKATELVEDFWGNVEKVKNGDNINIAVLPSAEREPKIIDAEHGHIVDVETEALIEQINYNRSKKQIVQDAIETETEDQVTNPNRTIEIEDLYNLTLKQQKSLLKYYGLRPGKTKAENAYLISHGTRGITLGDVQTRLSIELYPELIYRLNTVKVA